MYTATSNRGNLIWDIYNKISQSLYFIGHKQKKKKKIFFLLLFKQKCLCAINNLCAIQSPNSWRADALISHTFGNPEITTKIVTLSK